MMHVTDGRYANAAEMTPTQAKYRAEHAARRMKWASIKPVNPLPDASLSVAKTPTPAPLVSRALQAKAWSRQRCKQLGVSYQEVAENVSRSYEHSHARGIIMAEIREHYALSFEAIGKIFGGIHSSSVQYAIKKARSTSI